MTQQEIKSGMMPGEWKLSGTDIIDTVNNKLAISTDTDIEELRTEDMANAAAIVSAVNSTYGIGVNPEKVPDMIKKLRGAAALLYELDCADQSKDIEALLTSAKL